MRKADFQAKIKRIEITNKAAADGWQQSIRVILDDIELTNENLLELRQFKPSENVMVLLESAQMSLFDAGGRQHIAPGGAVTAGGDIGAEEDISSSDADSQGISPFVDIIEGDVPVQGKVARSWDF